jgi:hypothetical protein
MAFSEEIRLFIRSRAENCCEYCKSQDKFSPVFFTIDHINPIAAGGSNELENLAYACSLCNRLKWQKVAIFDSISNQSVPIFNPRNDTWLHHFQWSDDYFQLIGISAVGRATISELQLNREKLIRFRKEMFVIGQHPPT